MTHAEVLLWTQLKGKSLDGFKFRRQHSVGKYVIDFYCPDRKFSFEVDGVTHLSKSAVIHDYEKENYLKEHNIDTFRVTNEEIYDNVLNVVEKIRVRLRIKG